MRRGAKKEEHKVSLEEMVAAGLVRAPLKLEKTYRGEKVTARVEADGSVTFRGKRYGSLSTAGGAARAAVLKLEHLPATNGWDFWRYRDEQGNSLPLAALREEFALKRA